MANFEDSIAHKAHGLVHGDRAKDYGHPRFDFTAIGKVWTGLMQDLLKEDAVIDPYRVAVLMTGLKLCRLVKSPGHHDSRVDTIGYMLTMERLDEPEESGLTWYKKGGFPPGTFKNFEEALERADATAADDDLEDSGHSWAKENYTEDAPAVVNRYFTCDHCCFEFFAPAREGNIQRESCPVCGASVKFEHQDGPKCEEHNADHKCTVKQVHDSILNPLTGKPLGEGEIVAGMGIGDKHPTVKRVHDHEFEAPCIPPCPMWAAARTNTFPFSGETVEFKRP